MLSICSIVHLTAPPLPHPPPPGCQMFINCLKPICSNKNLKLLTVQELIPLLFKHIKLSVNTDKYVCRSI